MPNTSVQATGEAMPKIYRRTILKGGLVVAATAHTAVAVADVTPDPLLELIKAYREGEKAWIAYPEDLITRENEDGLMQSIYGRHEKALMEWKGPAPTREGAMAALRMANSESQDYAGSTMIAPLLAAALAYFEGVSA